MAYQSGSVKNTFELYDALASWMTGGGITAGPGWLLQDTTTLNSAGSGSGAVRDKVFWSSGSDGNKSLTVRGSFLNPENCRSGSAAGRFAGLTSSLAISKRPYHVENVYDYITFTGYLNWPYSTAGDSPVSRGTSSYGIYGPALKILPRQNTRRSEPNPIMTWPYQSSGSNCFYSLVNDRTYTKWNKGGTGNGGGMTGSDNFKHGWDDVPGWGYAGAANFDGRRRFHYTMRYFQNPGTVSSFENDDTTGAAYDMANGNAQGFFWTEDDGTRYSASENYSLCSSIIIHDSGSQDDFSYFLTEGGASEWHKNNLRTGEHTYLADFPTDVYNAQGVASMWWDGDDYIYVTDDEDVEPWYRYSIAADSWTTLASIAVNNGNEYHTPVISNGYIPSSYSGLTMTNSAGNPTDVILLAADDADNYISRYNVNGDEWNAGNDEIILPNSATWELRYDKGWWDSEFLWFYDSSAYALYKMNLTGSDYGKATGWTTHQSSINDLVPFISGATNRQMVPISNTHISKIRGQQQEWYLNTTREMNYWFQGDQDSVNIVTETSEGRYYWSHFGTYDSLVTTNTMKSTAAFTSDSIVTIPVDSTAGFVVGQEIIFADVSGSAIVEKNTILEIVNSTSFKVTNLSNNFGSGTLIGTDPHQAIVTGDSFMAGASLDGGGYQSNAMDSTYRVQPSIPQAVMSLTNKNAQGFYTPWPLMLYNTVRGLETFQAKGMLKNCWVIKNDPGNYPSLVSGDSLNIAGTTYKVFPLEETTTMMGNEIDRLLLLIKTE